MAHLPLNDHSINEKNDSGVLNLFPLGLQPRKWVNTNSCI